MKLHELIELYRRDQNAAVQILTHDRALMREVIAIDEAIAQRERLKKPAPDRLIFSWN